MITKVRGTQDFLNMALFNFIIQKSRTALERNNFHELQTPIIESIDLFKRSLGLETDVVSKQMFMIASQDEAICLRPEATAPTMRAFLEHTITSLPWKVFSYGPMFRYERPQKGRYRQFHQFNIEVIGAHTILYDAQLISMLDQLFANDFLLDNYALIINFLGCQQDRLQFKKILYEFLNSITDQLCTTCQRRKETNILRVFDCKEQNCQQLYTKAPHIADNLCTSCAQEWQLLQKALNMLSVTFSYQPTLVRGLDYYDKTVFEFVSDNLGAQSTFCGGGRYNNLAEQLGSSTNYPAIGASFGIERLLLLLEPLSAILNVKHKEQLIAIVPMQAEQQLLAMLVAQELNNKHCRNELILDHTSIKSALRKVDKIGAQFVVIIGPDEQQNGTVVVKNMMNGQQEVIKQLELAGALLAKAQPTPNLLLK